MIRPLDSDVTKPYKFIRFGAMDVTKPYKSIGPWMSPNPVNLYALGPFNGSGPKGGNLRIPHRRALVRSAGAGSGPRHTWCLHAAWCRALSKTGPTGAFSNVRQDMLMTQGGPPGGPPPPGSGCLVPARIGSCTLRWPKRHRAGRELLLE